MKHFGCCLRGFLPLHVTNIKHDKFSETKCSERPLGSIKSTALLRTTQSCTCARWPHSTDLSGFFSGSQWGKHWFISKAMFLDHFLTFFSKQKTGQASHTFTIDLICWLKRCQKKIWKTGVDISCNFTENRLYGAHLNIRQMAPNHDSFISR